MRDGSNPVPIGKAVAIVNDGENTEYIPVGPVWRTKTGRLLLNLDVEPVMWQDVRVRRVVLIETTVEGNEFYSVKPRHERDQERVDAADGRCGRPEDYDISEDRKPFGG